MRGVFFHDGWKKENKSDLFLCDCGGWGGDTLFTWRGEEGDVIHLTVVADGKTNANDGVYPSDGFEARRKRTTNANGRRGGGGGRGVKLFFCGFFPYFLVLRNVVSPKKGIKRIRFSIPSHFSLSAKEDL